MLRIHPSARKHGISDTDIRHAIKHAMRVENSDDWTRFYLGPGRDATLLEVITVDRSKRGELAIHAMKMRPKSRRIFLGES